MTDALGQPLVIGKSYGYSQQKNGFTYIVQGVVTKIKEDSITFEVKVRNRSLWGGVLTKDDFKELGKVTIKTPILFPL